MKPAIPNTPSDMLVTFPLIADPASYSPGTIDMIDDAEARAYWINVFVQHTPSITRLAAESQGDTDDARERAAAFRAQFEAILDDITADPASHGPLSIVRFCTLRRICLLEHGFDDPYVHVKRKENDAALALLPDLLADHDRVADTGDLDALWRTLIEGAFAGNIFDLGCVGTIEMYESGQVDFHAVRAKLPARPWAVDDFDPWLDRVRGDAAVAHRKAVVFIDNAGADVVLGMIPIVRQLLRQGARVVVTANTGAALNDVIYPELVELVDRVAAFDDVIRAARDDGRLTLAPSGNGLPVIDLRETDPLLAEEAVDADLLIIEGMGRGLETNFRTRFTCDTLKLAMIKEQDVADRIGAKLYDVVCRFEQAV
ncbi:MAG: DUF89 family protein [Phycisphaera sp.]|nr:DUF89 family protein [Phycisphaera sp.]